MADRADRLTQLESPEAKALNQTRVLMELNELLREDNIVAASGSLPSDLERVWTARRPGAYHLEYGFSCMGYEVSGALGVKLADPEREVYTFVGDGGFLMGHSDLLTSIQEGHKINVLLFNNSGHQCIHNLERSQGMGYLRHGIPLPRTVYRRIDRRLCSGKLFRDWSRLWRKNLARHHARRASCRCRSE